MDLHETKKKPLTVHSRWLIRRDMPEVMAIENEAFGYDAWREREFVDTLKGRNCIAIVAEHSEQVVGYMVYLLNLRSFEIINFAVAAEFRRQEIGRQLLQKLIGKLSRRRSRIVADVRETNLAALNFFKACGFLAEGILKDRFDETDEDAIRMVFERCQQGQLFGENPKPPRAGR